MPETQINVVDNAASAYNFASAGYGNIDISAGYSSYVVGSSGNWELKPAAGGYSAIISGQSNHAYGENVTIIGGINNKVYGSNVVLIGCNDLTIHESNITIINGKIIRRHSTHTIRIHL